MKTYLILTAICSILAVLRFDKLMRIILLKLLFPKITIEELERFEKKTRSKYFWNQKRNQKL
tara:strand:- start:9 stop:194 length:186 start_codon:yes stop_codon:yes gene_type:complete